MVGRSARQEERRARRRPPTVPRDSHPSQNPIHRAELFHAALLQSHPRTYATVAAHFGVSTALVSYHLSLLTKLPPAFVAWLRAVEDPLLLRTITARRLRAATRIADEAAKERFLAALVRQAQARLACAGSSPRSKERSP